MKLKSLSIILFAAVLASCGKSESASGSNGENGTNGEEPTSVTVSIEEPDFTDDLADACGINRRNSDKVQVKKEDGDQFNYTMDIPVEIFRQMTIPNKYDIDVRTVLLDKDGQQLGFFYLTSDSREKLVYALTTGRKTVLTFRRREGKALPLSKAKTAEICVAKIGEENMAANYGQKTDDENKDTDSVNPTPDASDTYDMDTEGDI